MLLCAGILTCLRRSDSLLRAAAFETNARVFDHQPLRRHAAGHFHAEAGRATRAPAHYLLGHACIKSGLFLCAGMLLHRLQSVDELKLHGRAKGLPLLGLLMAALALLLAGAPLSALSEVAS